ncbi:YcdB/YcdC domain-containing protein [Brevibacillus sp. 179-C9.3 HS]|uniref:YcdB/YcdC domain-containing protein n=1 Tax=unclassified Brevibacillus TaxID=2684853 RepID=UPI0039A06874
MKHTKKLASTLLMASLLTTTPLWGQTPTMTAQAATDQGQEVKLSPAAEKTLQTLYTIQPELKSMDKMIYGPKNGVYELRFDTVVAPDKMQLYASVNLDATTGALHSYENEQEMQKQNNKPTEEVAKQKSAAFLQKLLGDDFKKYKATQTTKGEWDAVTYTRHEHGVPVFTDRYVVGVNSTSVMYVNTFEGAPLRAASSLFAKPGKVLSQEEVTGKVASLMELTYSAHKKETGKPALKYSLESTGYLNAVTGEEIESASSHKTRYSDAIAVKPGGKRFTASNADEAAKVLTEEFQIKMDGVKLETDTHTPAEMKGEGETIYKSKGRGVSITVYTNNNEVTGFQVRGKAESASATQHGNKPANAQLSYEQAKEKAVQFLQPYLDPSVKELKIDQNKIMMPSATAYSFSFYALHDGVVVTDQQYLVNVDGQTGEIVNFMDYFTKPSAPFPDKKIAISKEAAAKQFLKDRPAVLGYMFPVQNEKVQAKPTLVYSIDTVSYFLLDAVTGESFK